MACQSVEIPSSDITLVQSITDIIESIALEEVGIANILNSEGCKIQKALDIATTVDELVLINKSVSDTLENVIKSQMLLNFKLGETGDILKKLDIKVNC